MTGRPAGTVFPTRGGAGLAGEPRLAVRDLSSPPRVLGVSFEARAGEIVGLAGLVGSGRTETLRRSSARWRAKAARVSSTAGRSRSPPAAAIDAGLGFILEDRQVESIFPDHSLLANICVAAASSSRGERLSGALPFILSPRRMSEVAERLRAALQVKATRSRVRSRACPVAISKRRSWRAGSQPSRAWCSPTSRPRGVSIGSKIELYRLLRKLAAEGAAVVIVSSEFEEPGPGRPHLCHARRPYRRRGQSRWSRRR